MICFKKLPKYNVLRKFKKDVFNVLKENLQKNFVRNARFNKIIKLPEAERRQKKIFSFPFKYDLNTFFVTKKKIPIVNNRKTKSLFPAMWRSDINLTKYGLNKLNNRRESLFYFIKKIRKDTVLSKKNYIKSKLIKNFDKGMLKPINFIKKKKFFFKNFRTSNNFNYEEWLKFKHKYNYKEFIKKTKENINKSSKIFKKFRFKNKYKIDLNKIYKNNFNQKYKKNDLKFILNKSKKLIKKLLIFTKKIYKIISFNQYNNKQLKILNYCNNYIYTFEKLYLEKIYRKNKNKINSINQILKKKLKLNLSGFEIRFFNKKTRYINQYNKIYHLKRKTPLIISKPTDLWFLFFFYRFFYKNFSSFFSRKILRYKFSYNLIANLYVNINCNNLNLKKKIVFYKTKMFLDLNFIDFILGFKFNNINYIRSKNYFIEKKLYKSNLYKNKYKLFINKLKNYEI